MWNGSQKVNSMMLAKRTYDDLWAQACWLFEELSVTREWLSFFRRDCIRITLNRFFLKDGCLWAHLTIVCSALRVARRYLPILIAEPKPSIHPTPIGTSCSFWLAVGSHRILNSGSAFLPYYCVVIVTPMWMSYFVLPDSAFLSIERSRLVC